MKRTARLLVGVIGCLLLMTPATSGGMGKQGADYVLSYYMAGSSTRQLSIKTQKGQLLSLLEVPEGVELSVHVVRGEMTNLDKTTGATLFTGDVSIRTRASSELVDGALLGQMMQAPLRLDVQDAIVELTRKARSR